MLFSLRYFKMTWFCHVYVMGKLMYKGETRAGLHSQDSVSLRFQELVVLYEEGVLNCDNKTDSVHKHSLCLL